MRTSLAISILGLAVSFSCNKEESTAPEPAPADAAAEETGAAEEAPAEEAAAPAEAKVWAQMTKEERGKHMGMVVMPHMKEAFQAYDAEAFAEFNCATCHGDDAKEVGFEMPNALTPLAANDPWQSAVDMDEAMAKFMAETVVPKMAEDLSMEAGPGEGQFGCFSCHLKDE